MPRPAPGVRIYADSCLYYHVIKQERNGLDLLWPAPLKLLTAALDGRVHLIASTLVRVEVSGWKGDVASTRHQQLLDKYFSHEHIDVVELDDTIADETFLLAKDEHLNGADAAHLATAIRHQADYFMSHDGAFPYGKTIGGVEITECYPVWTENLEDEAIDHTAATELAKLEARNQRRRLRDAARAATERTAASRT